MQTPTLALMKLSSICSVISATSNLSTIYPELINIANLCICKRLIYLFRLNADAKEVNIESDKVYTSFRNRTQWCSKIIICFKYCFLFFLSLVFLSILSSSTIFWKKKNTDFKTGTFISILASKPTWLTINCDELNFKTIFIFFCNGEQNFRERPKRVQNTCLDLTMIQGFWYTFSLPDSIAL